MINSKYLVIDEKMFEYEYRSYPNSIKHAFTVLQENKDKVDANDWESLIKKDAYVVDICIKAGIEFLDYLTYMPTGAFGTNDWLEEIIIPNNITSIEDASFKSNTRLKKVTIPTSIGYLGEYCFAGCSALQDIYYEGTQEQWENISMSRTVFRYKYNDDSQITIHCSDGDIVE